MKKIVSVILAFFMMACVMPVGVFRAAEQLTYYEYLSMYYIINDGEVSFVGFSPYGITAKIPSEVDGLPVTSVGDGMFSGCHSVNRVIFPNTITSIGEGMFNECWALDYVFIPDSITFIHSEAFYDCPNLKLYIECANSYAVNYAENKKYSYEIVHTSDSYEVISEPTCTLSGHTEFYCANCNGYEIIKTEPLGHEYVYSVKEPTCTESGFEKQTCSRCGDTKTNETDALGHSYEATVTEPTCKDKGYTTYTCSCGDSYKSDYVDASGVHSFIETEKVSPTINSQGYTVYTCEDCGETEKRNFTDFKVVNLTVNPNDVGFAVSWDAFEGANSYYVRIREKDGTTNITNVNVKATSYEFVIGKNGLSLDYDKEYTIQVIAQVGATYQAWADADKVTSKMVVGNRVLEIKTTPYSLGAEVTFKPVEGANNYWVFVRNAKDDSAVHTTNTTTTSVKIVNNMVGGTEYYVQIVAFKDNTALDTRQNAIKTKFVAPYVLPSTYNIAAKTPTTFSITWDAVAGADTYFVQVRDENDAPVRTVTSKNKTIAAVAMCSDGSKLSANTTYKFRIAATINGVTTGYGDWMTYTTGDYEAVTVNAEKVDNKVKISWNDISDSHAVYLYKIDANGKKTYFKYLENGETSYTIKAPASGSYSYGVITVQRNMSGDCYNPIAVSNTLTF